MEPKLPLYTKTTGESTTLNDRLGTVIAVFQDAQVAEWFKNLSRTSYLQEEQIEKLETKIEDLEERLATNFEN